MLYLLLQTKPEIYWPRVLSVLSRPSFSATRSTQHPTDCFIRHTISTRDVTEWFSLFNPLEHGTPFRRWDLPARIGCGVKVARQRCKQRIVKGRGKQIIVGRGSGGLFLVDQQIASLNEEPFKRDAC